MQKIKKKLDDYIGSAKRICYNLKSELDVFVDEFVELDGIKEIM